MYSINPIEDPFYDNDLMCESVNFETIDNNRDRIIFL